MKTIEVAVGVVLRDHKIFISKRADDLHQGGKWEFPGGKREPDEPMADALARELQEEIGIQVKHQNPLLVIEHDYGDKRVVLDVRIVDQFDGEPGHQEGQIAQWVAVSELQNYTFPEANKAIVEKLQTELDN